MSWLLQVLGNILGGQVFFLGRGMVHMDAVAARPSQAFTNMYDSNCFYIFIGWFAGFAAINRSANSFGVVFIMFLHCMYFWAGNWAGRHCSVQQY